MNWIRRFRNSIVFAALVLLALPCDALAGFEWIGYWKDQSEVTGQGSTSFLFSGYDVPDGVIRVQGKIEGQLGFSQPPGNPFPIFPPFGIGTSSSMVLSRHFRLSGSPGGWDVDLDWNVVESTRFWAHVSTSGPYSTMYVEDASQHREPFYFHYNATDHKVHLPDGDYTFNLGASGSLSFDRPPWGWTSPFSVYYGRFSYHFSGSLQATAVPEPSSWLIIGQGFCTSGALIFVSKRRQRHGGRTASG